MRKHKGKGKREMKVKNHKGKLICIIIALCACIVTTFATREIVKYHHENYLDMRTVVDFDVTETGLYLYTNDGNGYYWER